MASKKELRDTPPARPPARRASVPLRLLGPRAGHRLHGSACNGREDCIQRLRDDARQQDIEGFKDTIKNRRRGRKDKLTLQDRSTRAPAIRLLLPLQHLHLHSSGHGVEKIKQIFDDASKRVHSIIAHAQRGPPGGAQALVQNAANRDEAAWPFIMVKVDVRIGAVFQRDLAALFVSVVRRRRQVSRRRRLGGHRGLGWLARPGRFGRLGRPDSKITCHQCLQQAAVLYALIRSLQHCT